MRWVFWLLLAQVVWADPVVLISIDGLRPDYVLEADRHGLRIPTLRRLLAESTYATGVRGVAPTLTYPSHVTLVTGAAPARHGVHSNKTFDPLGLNMKGWYWYAEDVRVPALWELVKTSANVHWPVTVGARGITWNVPQYWRSGLPDDRKLLRVFSTPGLLDALESEVGVPYADGINELLSGDENRARFAARLIATRQPDFATVYFAAFDHEQHASGPFSPRSLATLEKLDSILGGLLASIPPQYVICVVSDHGFTACDTALNLGVALREAGLIECGPGDRVKSWKAMAWDAGGCAAVMVNDPAVLPQVQALLLELAEDPANGISRVMGRAELDATGAFPEAAFVVTLKPNFYADTRLSGDLVRPGDDPGMHGHWPDLADMNAAFFLRGPGIARGRSLGVIDMRAIAPTLARLLGVRLPGAEVEALEVR